MSTPAGDRFDVVLAGGGLAAGLTALALRQRHPRLRLALCEAGSSLGGNHTWSFFATDLDAEAAALVEPLVQARWRHIEVAFPGQRRRLDTGYASVSSAALDTAVRGVFTSPGSTLLLGQRVQSVRAREVVLDDGRVLAAPLVLDGRGPGGPPRFVDGQAFQKFVGLEVEIDPTAGTRPDLETATIMDADLPQSDGFRFVYLLPLGPTRLLCEDTYYADEPHLDRALLRARVLAYLGRRGFAVTRVLREEAGALTLPFGDDGLPPLGSPVRLGARGGWFHPTTGYTLPFAARVALAIAHRPEDPLPALGALSQAHAPQARFARRLNRLLFRAVKPADRAGVLARFYRLPRPIIERFYAGETTALDRARVLLGRPPRGVSLRAAFSALQTA